MKKKNDDGVIPEFTVNKNGVVIKKCCASCEHKEACHSEGDKRKCTRFDTVVNKNDLCKDWSISKQIEGLKLKR